MSNLGKIFEGNWDEIKGNVKKQWGKLTKDDITEIDGSYDAFIGKIKKAYGHKAEEIEEQVGKFLDENSAEINAKIKDISHDFNNIKEKVSDKTDEIKTIVKECVSEYFDKFKESALETEEKLAAYCKTNPLKTASFLVLASLAFATVMCTRMK